MPNALAPMIDTHKKKEPKQQQTRASHTKPVLVGSRTAYILDVSQTEGAELPQLTERTKGELGAYRERPIDFTITQGIALEFKESIAPDSA